MCIVIFLFFFLLWQSHSSTVEGGSHYGNKPHGELVASNHDGATCHSCHACKWHYSSWALGKPTKKNLNPSFSLTPPSNNFHPFWFTKTLASCNFLWKPAFYFFSIFYASTSTYLPKTRWGASLKAQKGKKEIASPHFNTVTNPQPSPLPLRREAGAVVPMATNGPHCSQTSPHSLLTKRHTHTHTIAHRNTGD